jgi:acyl-CoA thioester hydrolase
MTAPFRWPFRTTVPVRFRDLDPYGHVNNAVYVTYVEQARCECYLALMERTDPTPQGVGLDFVVARAEVDYVAPCHHGDVLAIDVWPERVGASSFAFVYEARRQDGGVVARARTVLVAFDHERREKKPLPDALRARLEAGLRSAGGAR